MELRQAAGQEALEETAGGSGEDREHIPSPSRGCTSPASPAPPTPGILSPLPRGPLFPASSEGKGHQPQACGRGALHLPAGGAAGPGLLPHSPAASPPTTSGGLSWSLCKESSLLRARYQGMLEVTVQGLGAARSRPCPATTQTLTRQHGSPDPDRRRPLSPTRTGPDHPFPTGRRCPGAGSTPARQGSLLGQTTPWSSRMSKAEPQCGVPGRPGPPSSGWPPDHTPSLRPCSSAPPTVSRAPQVGLRPPASASPGALPASDQGGCRSWVLAPSALAWVLRVGEGRPPRSRPEASRSRGEGARDLPSGRWSRAPVAPA